MQVSISDVSPYLFFREGEVDRGLGMEGRRVEEGEGRVLRLDEQRDFGAAEDDSLGPAAGEPVHDLEIRTEALVLDDPAGQLVVDDAVDEPPFGRLGDEDDQAVFFLETLPVEFHLHGVARPEKADGGEALAADFGRRGVGDVEKGDLDRGLDGLGRPVHRVGADDHAFRPGRFDPAGGVDHQIRHPLPIVRFLESLDLGELHRPKNEPGRGVSAQALLDALVDEPVIVRRRMPGHSADEADRFHRVSLMPGREHAKL